MDRIDPLRRLLVKLTGLAGCGLLLGLPACGGGGEDRETAAASAPGRDAPPADPCADLDGLTSDQIALRGTFGYVDRSEDPDLVCRGCEFWKEPASGSICGGCTLFAGPVHPEGFCDSYAEA